MQRSNIKLFGGNSNKELAQEIASELNMPLGEAAISRFSDGEVSINIYETVRGCDVFLIQSTCPPVNDNLMELMMMLDALRRASAQKITAVIPYYGYGRQDRKAGRRDPIAAKVVANMISMGADSVLTMDLHARQIQGFFDIPVDHITGIHTLASHYLERHFQGDDLVLVSPDLGSLGRARAFAKRLDAPLAIIDKRRPRPNHAEVVNIVGDVSGKRAIIVDDLMDTGGTFIGAAQALIDNGASEVYACCTHGVLSGDTVERLAESQIKELVITNTIPLPEEKTHPKIRVLSVASVIAKAINYIYEDHTIVTLTEN